MTILSDRPRYLREVAALQALAWLCRFAAFWFLLEAFRVGGSVENVLLVFAVNQVAGAVPFTPGGAGVQQALLVKVFATSAPTAVVAAYSVGQQIAIAVFTALRRPRRGRASSSASAPSERCCTPGAPRATPSAPPSAAAMRRRARLEPWSGERPRRRPAARDRRARATARARLALLKALARLAHERDGLGEDAGDHRADLLGLGLGVALHVHALRPPRPSCRQRA